MTEREAALEDAIRECLVVADRADEWRQDPISMAIRAGAMECVHVLFVMKTGKSPCQRCGRVLPEKGRGLCRGCYVEDATNAICGKIIAGNNCKI